MAFVEIISSKLNIPSKSIAAVIEMLNEGSTTPFIARYRKDKTGNLDEVAIEQIREEQKLQQELADRRKFIHETITAQGKMTDELNSKIESATTLVELEDLYLPYKQKRKTRAVVAKENGLEPLANFILEQKSFHVNAEAGKFVNDKVATTEDALQGARDIIAEMINEDAELRAGLRKLFENKALMHATVVKGKEEAAAKFKDYFDFREPISKIPSHRILAILRGFLEGFLRMSIEPEEEIAIDVINKAYVKSNTPAAEEVRKAVKDAYKRLLQPSLETEFRTTLKAKADEEAINVFAENLKQLLLSSPLGSKRVLAIDPGYRSGCKVVCLDEKGDLKTNDIIYVHEQNKLDNSAAKIRNLAEMYRIEAIAIGDGTAGRETEQFIKKLELGVPIYLVNEDGASVYSASETAREEFPDYDVTVRGAVSIGRRLVDPLAELVKIDPKSIGVGQYQHDVNQFRLKEKLDQTVISCVNAVGVNINTASKNLLSYVSGIGPSIADNIIKYRNEKGAFRSRQQLLEVPRLGAKAFEQSAGFIRVKGGENILDSSAVHPESYPVVSKIADDLGVTTTELVGNQKLVESVDVKKYKDFGELTVRDILNELKKPGLDPRSEVQAFEFASVYVIDDLQIGAIVPGIVTNITRFGAFVDVGVKQDGLVHVSEIAHKYIQDPGEVLKLNQQVKVKVLEIDIARKRIALSIKQAEENISRAPSVKLRPMQKKAEEPKPMEDALAALKRKFTK
jgi:protein Tex